MNQDDDEFELVDELELQLVDPVPEQLEEPPFDFIEVDIGQYESAFAETREAISNHILLSIELEADTKRINRELEGLINDIKRTSESEWEAARFASLSPFTIK